VSRPRPLRPSDAVPEGLLVAIGAVQGITGLLAVLVPLQFAIWWVLPARADAALAVLAGLGLAQLATAWASADGRTWGPMGGAALTVAIGVLATAFDVWALSHLSFTLFMLFIPPMALLAAVLSPLGVSRARRCQAARAKLATLSAQRSGPRFGTT